MRRSPLEISGQSILNCDHLVRKNVLGPKRLKGLMDRLCSQETRSFLELRLGFAQIRGVIIQIELLQM